ncbi:hypothetical protein [Lentibacillus salinarum]|uniref:HTH cro/C1-type domain-containing protein n=1 Tax=Lentibacillus salinarum TaxID=446820 RepID=A0ABW3ZU52_9BACI
MEDKKLYMKLLGKHLRGYRLVKNLTQKELATNVRQLLMFRIIYRQNNWNGPGLRVTVWRRLKGMSPAYFGCVLP